MQVATSAVQNIHLHAQVGASRTAQCYLDTLLILNLLPELVLELGGLLLLGSNLLRLHVGLVASEVYLHIANCLLFDTRLKPN